MSVRTFDATVYVADDDSLQSSSVDYHTLICSGDTIRVASQRNPAYDDTGFDGELCWSVVSGTTYLYLHNGTEWKRCAFSSYS